MGADHRPYPGPGAPSGGPGVSPGPGGTGGRPPGQAPALEKLQSSSHDPNPTGALAHQARVSHGERSEPSASGGLVCTPQGKVALVTGAAQGLGRATALRLAAD